MSLFAELKRRNVIRVAVAYGVLSWLVMQIADVLVGTLELPTVWGKAVLGLLALGFLPVVIFSWVYEMTPDGLKRESAISREESITAHTARKLDVVVIILLVMAMGLFAVDRFVGPREVVQAGQADVSAPNADADGRASIAVLPFANMSGNPENEYFSDGLTETLLHMLAQVDDLRVAARTSAFAFKDTNTDIREIARQLDVSAVLEGSVQRSGQRVRITAQLIDAANGSHLWSENFDRDLDDIFAIQDEIANAVARALAVSLLGQQATEQPATTAHPIESVGTTSTEAFDHYLRGLQFLTEDSYSSLNDAERAFKEALLVDPDFREARIALTYTYISMGETALLLATEANSRGRAALAPLLATGSSDPLAAAYDLFLDYREHRYEGLLNSADRISFFARLAPSMARAPNEPILYVMAVEILDNVEGRDEERLEYIERGLKLDPLNTDLWIWKGRILGFDLNRLDEALAAFQRITEIEPNNANGHGLSGFIYRRQNRLAEEAHSYILGARIDRQDHELPAFVAMALINMGLLDDARAWIERAQLLNAEGGATVAAQLRYLYLSGATDEAQSLAESVLRGRVSNRRGMYSTAATVYGRIMQQRDRVDDALALLEELSPGVTTDLGYQAQDLYALQHVRLVAALLGETFDDEQRQQLRESQAPYLDRVLPGWRDIDTTAAHRFIYGLQDLDSAATAVAQDLLSGRDLAMDQIELGFRSHQPLLQHRAVQDALKQVQARLETQVELYRQMLNDGRIPAS